MNPIEFNKKYEKWLEPGHYGLDLYKKEAIAYLDAEFKELILLPDFSYSQIKSKFNRYCFYCVGVSEEKVKEIENTLKQIYNT